MDDIHLHAADRVRRPKTLRFLSGGQRLRGYFVRFRLELGGGIRGSDRLGPTRAAAHNCRAIRSSLPKPLELAQAWVPLSRIQEGSADIRRYTARFEEHFKRGNYAGNETISAGNGSATEVDLLLQLSPLMLNPDYIICQLPYPLLLQLSPQNLDVQVSSGDGFYSTPQSFLVYNPPP